MYTIYLGNQKKGQGLNQVQFKEFVKVEDPDEFNDWIHALTELDPPLIYKDDADREGIFRAFSTTATDHPRTFSITGTEAGGGVPELEQWGVRMRIIRK